MGKRPTVVPLSEEEQKLVSEVLNWICIRKSYRGQDHHQNLHQNEDIMDRSEAKSLLWKFWFAQIPKLSLSVQTSILSRRGSWTWRWDLCIYLSWFSWLLSASQRWRLDRDFSKVWDHLDTGFVKFISRYYHLPAQFQEITWLVMNKADTTTAKEKPLTERSPFLWNTVPMFWLNTEDGAENAFLPKGWVADNEDDVVYANFSVEGLKVNTLV